MNPAVRCARWLLFLIVFSSVACAQTERGDQNVLVYDFYEKGIRNAELVIKGKAGSNLFSITKRDTKSNRWLPETKADEVDVADNPDFQLSGSILSLPAVIQEARKIDWSSLQAVGWPDEDSIYVRHRDLTESVAGKTITATYWTLKDATLPMDLILGPNNELIAGIDASNDNCLVLRNYENFTTLKKWSDAKVSPARFGYRDLGKSMVQMSDGVNLATLVYLPDDETDGSYPVVFIRTPYGIGDLIDRYWHYCARGYAVVLQACRGTSYWDPEYKSEGTWELCINEVSDGAEALEWITRQTWCDGNIGMQGGSYVGYTQWACSMAGNPALKCIIPEVSMGTVFSDQPYMGGGFVEGLAYYGFFMMNLELMMGRTWTEVLHHRPLIEIDSFATGKDLPQWNALLEHWTNDNYWKRQDWYRPQYSRDFASLQISGWFDDDFLGTRRNWELMQRTGSKPQRLIVGPWKHGYNRDRKLNGFSFGNDALRDDIWILKQKWYDRFLKGIDNDVEKPRVDYFIIGANKWRTATRWPPTEVDLQKWYLHSRGKAHQRMTDGRLSKSLPQEVESRDIYTYDPEDPPPNWMSFERMTRWEDVQTFPYDFKDIEARQDVVVYTSPPLKEDLTLAGDITAVLYASCNVRDTDWWVHVSDVYPDGQSVRLALGLLRARFRNLEDKQFHILGSNFEKEELLSGNMKDVVRYEIAISSIAAQFKKGHRVRVAVMNACDNYSFPNSNTGGHESYVTHTVSGKMAVHHSSRYPSHVVLPVLPN